MIIIVKIKYGNKGKAGVHSCNIDFNFLILIVIIKSFDGK